MVNAMDKNTVGKVQIIRKALMTSPLAFEFGSKGVDIVLFDNEAIESSLDYF